MTHAWLFLEMEISMPGFSWKFPGKGNFQEKEISFSWKFPGKARHGNFHFQEKPGMIIKVDDSMHSYARLIDMCNMTH